MGFEARNVDDERNLDDELQEIEWKIDEEERTRDLKHTIVRG